jgi:secondary thiamine-phosphate synthase enzyme
MRESLLENTVELNALKSTHTLVDIKTLEHLEFVDLTARISELVERSRVSSGIVSIQTRHTTTGIMINEHEPLPISDMKRVLERIVPEGDDYEHDNLAVRTVNLTPDERRNGHSHCRSLFLPSSESINVAGGELQLGRWQRIFFVELDGPRERLISVAILGI